MLFNTVQKHTFVIEIICFVSYCERKVIVILYVCIEGGIQIPVQEFYFVFIVIYFLHIVKLNNNTQIKKEVMTHHNTVTMKYKTTQSKNKLTVN